MIRDGAAAQNGKTNETKPSDGASARNREPERGREINETAAPWFVPGSSSGLSGSSGSSTPVDRMEAVVATMVPRVMVVAVVAIVAMLVCRSSQKIVTLTRYVCSFDSHVDYVCSCDSHIDYVCSCDSHDDYEIHEGCDSHVDYELHEGCDSHVDYMKAVIVTVTMCRTVIVMLTMNCTMK